VTAGAAALSSEICQILGGRGYARDQQMLTRPRTGNIKQSALGFVDIVELCFVGGVGDALVERQGLDVSVYLTLAGIKVLECRSIGQGYDAELTDVRKRADKNLGRPADSDNDALLPPPRPGRFWH
jgi:hypothetical protein